MIKPLKSEQLVLDSFDQIKRTLTPDQVAHYKKKFREFEAEFKAKLGPTADPDLIRFNAEIRAKLRCMVEWDDEKNKNGPKRPIWTGHGREDSSR